MNCSCATTGAMPPKLPGQATPGQKPPGGAGAAPPTHHGGGGGGKTGAMDGSKYLHQRTAPEDPAKAGQFLDQVMAATAQFADPAAAKAAGYDFSVLDKPDHPQRYHMKNKALEADGAVADPTKPESLIYWKADDGSLKLIGAVFRATGQAPDLGLGMWHSHHSANNPKLMKHVWFYPQDLNVAFQEATPDQLKS